MLSDINISAHDSLCFIVNDINAYGEFSQYLEQEMQGWSRRKEQMFNRKWLSEAVGYLKENL